MIKAYGKAIPKAWRRIARIFVALGDPSSAANRVDVRGRRAPQHRRRSSRRPTLSRTAVAHHLRVLREAGVLRQRKNRPGESISGPTRIPFGKRWTQSKEYVTALDSTGAALERGVHPA